MLRSELRARTLPRVKPSKDGGTEPRGCSGNPPCQPSRQRIRPVIGAAAVFFVARQARFQVLHRKIPEREGGPLLCHTYSQLLG
jgi:hypothetical protein